LDIFDQIGPIEELVKELLIFKRYQLDVKDIKYLLWRWQKHEVMFPTVGFLALQFFCVVGSQIEPERIFSLVGILTNLRRCHLQIDNFKKLIFVEKIGVMVL